MPEPFPVHTPDSAPAAACPLLEEVRADFGMIPNLEGVMASAPPLLRAYVRLWAGFQATGLTPAEQQVVHQVSNFENNCTYCVPWHSMLAERAGLDAEAVQALRDGAALADPRLEALRRFTRTLLRTNGNPAPADLDAFLATGYTRENALEVVLGLALKLMSNFTNGMAQTPLDDAVKKRAWVKPSLNSPG